MAMALEKREVAGFDEVVLRGPGEVVIEQVDAAGPEGLLVEADEAVVSRIGAELRGTRLVLGPQLAWYEWLTAWLTWPWRAWWGIRYRVSARTIRGLSIAGSGAIKASRLATDRCGLRISGSGRIAVEGVQAGSVDATIAGSGSITCAGTAGQVRAEISGSGTIGAEGLAAHDAAVSISGSGRISVAAEATLDVRIAGSGSVRYQGSPRISSSISGSGRIRRA